VNCRRAPSLEACASASEAHRLRRFYEPANPYVSGTKRLNAS